MEYGVGVVFFCLFVLFFFGGVVLVGWGHNQRFFSLFWGSISTFPALCD